MLDVSSQDGGATFDAVEIAHEHTFRGDFGYDETEAMDHQVQIARNVLGNRIFYAWAASDPETVGFGESDNLAPNLHIAGLRLEDKALAGPHDITKGDMVWEGKILWPNLAPIVIARDGKYRLPVVTAELLTGDIQSPTAFHYWAAKAVIDESEFGAAGSLSGEDPYQPPKPPQPEPGPEDDAGPSGGSDAGPGGVSDTGPGGGDDVKGSDDAKGGLSDTKGDAKGGSKGGSKSGSSGGGCAISADRPATLRVLRGLEQAAARAPPDAGDRAA